MSNWRSERLRYSFHPSRWFAGSASMRSGVIGRAGKLVPMIAADTTRAAPSVRASQSADALRLRFIFAVAISACYSFPSTSTIEIIRLPPQERRSADFQSAALRIFQRAVRFKGVAGWKPCDTADWKSALLRPGEISPWTSGCLVGPL